jgi:hypothetical protein
VTAVVDVRGSHNKDGEKAVAVLLQDASKESTPRKVRFVSIPIIVVNARRNVNQCIIRMNDNDDRRRMLNG